jgi:hypothetical protein
MREMDEMKMTKKNLFVKFFYLIEEENFYFEFYKEWSSLCNGLFKFKF